MSAPPRTAPETPTTDAAPREAPPREARLENAATVVSAPLALAVAFAFCMVAFGRPGGERFFVAAIALVAGTWTALRLRRALGLLARLTQRAFEDAARARSDAAEVRRAKDELVRVLGHELRTPLNAILGWTTLLRRCPDDPATVRRATETIDRSARAQVRLVEAIETLSRRGRADSESSAPPSP